MTLTNLINGKLQKFHNSEIENGNAGFRTTNMRARCSDSQGHVRPQINAHKATSHLIQTSNGSN